MPALSSILFVTCPVSVLSFMLFVCYDMMMDSMNLVSNSNIQKTVKYIKCASHSSQVRIKDKRVQIIYFVK